MLYQILSNQWFPSYQARLIPQVYIQVVFKAIIISLINSLVKSVNNRFTNNQNLLIKRKIDPVKFQQKGKVKEEQGHHN